MAAELVNAATSEKLSEMDWTKSIQICELVTRDHRQARDVIKAIKKRLGSKNKDTQLFAVMLLEVLMNNIGEPIHTQVIDTGILPLLVKLVKKKSNSDLPVREKIFLLLDATQTSLGGASGKFPQYYSAYYDLVSAGVQFSQRPEVLPKNYSTSDSSKSNSSNGELATTGNDRSAPPTAPQAVPESSIIQKAGSALEVLRDVLDAIDTRYPEQAKDEFTLDLVEQCSFHKQRVMHLAVTSRDEKSISQAIELNDQLQQALSRHEALVSGRSTLTATQVDHEDAEEEDPEQLFRRMRKGKACVRPEAENHQTDRPLGLLGSAVPADRLNRPLIRPISLEPKQGPITTRPAAAVSIPPPPAKHVEREKFFQENKADGSGLGGHMRGLSLHSRNASSSRSDSFDFSD
ncbi:TOM1-like protein 5 isoform X1 [Cynara cardunculus var. scolymus]|uniref:TOM1-like protein 5 isoform X1 n=2 Tax=Cynara cardunculus var. scolymus TaxID=59895 RepID=UPI000D62765F|nr:TOM1-like protein 5 isoform X1 [Cynara cardunculus var. scolymus]XP_024982657.1 TOM1-like protein 5 isoform X1 [Cynara cardunculus var. scolymus]XP_024982658.1 TOM1-like protein 5 isoform X1 [Cynara cardunculus var. scolymus]